MILKYIYKIKDFVIKEKKVILSIFVMILLPILINCMFYGNYEKKLKLAYINNELIKHPRNMFKGKTFVTDTYPIFKEVVFMGDSYSHFISYDLGFDVMNYSCPGLKLKDLKYVFDMASKSNKKYAIIFIGPNDFIAQTPLNEFKECFETYIKMLKDEMGAKVILTSYLPSKYTIAEESKGIFKNTIDMYDKEIKEISDENEGVFYLDILTDYDVDKYSKYTIENNDAIHLNYDFNVSLINRLYDLIIDIEIQDIK